MTLESYRTAERVRRGVGQLYRDVEQLKRRPGAIIGGPFADRIHDHTFVGEGPFWYNYLIDDSYAGLGPEGKVLPTLHGHTYKVYSTIPGAVSDANTNRQAVGQSSSFLICEGIYTINSGITNNPPNSGSYHFYGTGQGSEIRPGADPITIFTNAPLVIQSQVSYHDLYFNAAGQSGVTFLDYGGSVRGLVDHCILNTSAGGLAIAPGNGAVGLLVSNCNIQGSGRGIGGFFELECFIVNNVFESGMDIGIDLDNCAHFLVVGNKFDQLDTAIRFRANAFISNVVISGNIIELGSASVGIKFDAGLNIQAAIAISGNDFSNIGDGSVGIDFNLATLASAVIRGISISGNTFHGGGDFSTGIGIRGGMGVYQCIISNSAFHRFPAGNEIVNWAGNGNEAMHNISSRDISGVSTKQPLADIGNPVGHSLAISGQQAQSLPVR